MTDAWSVNDGEVGDILARVRLSSQLDTATGETHVDGRLSRKSQSAAMGSLLQASRGS
jgi:hypothetical protein